MADEGVVAGAIAQKPDVIYAIMNNPLVWLLLCLVVIFFIISRWTGKDKKPEQSPFYGVKVREDVTRKRLNRRSNVLGSQTNYALIRGFNKIGKTIKYEQIYLSPKGSDDIKEYFNLEFRKFGFWAWLMYAIRHKCEHLILDPKIVKISHKDRQIIINPVAHIIEDSGIWTLQTRKETGYIDDLNLKYDLENTKGFTSDFLRRLSNEHPGQAIFTERLSHGAELEEKSKQSRISRWVGGK
jgi:hypothetical protein